MKPFTRALALAAAICGIAISQGVSAQTVLRYSNWLPAGHPLRTQVMDPWA